MAGSKQPKSKMQRALDSGKDIKTDPPRVRSEVTGEGRSTCEAVLQTPAADWGGVPVNLYFLPTGYRFRVPHKPIWFETLQE